MGFHPRRSRLYQTFFFRHLNSFEELAKLNFDSKVCFKEFLLPLEEHFSHSPIVMVLKEVHALFLRICSSDPANSFNMGSRINVNRSQQFWGKFQIIIKNK